MTIPQTMRAAFIRATGDVDAIQVGDLPVPRPGPTDVLAKHIIGASKWIVEEFKGRVPRTMAELLTLPGIA